MTFAKRHPLCVHKFIIGMTFIKKLVHRLLTEAPKKHHGLGTAAGACVLLEPRRTSVAYRVLPYVLQTVTMQLKRMERRWSITRMSAAFHGQGCAVQAFDDTCGSKQFFRLQDPMTHALGSTNCSCFCIL